MGSLPPPEGIRVQYKEGVAGVKALGRGGREVNFVHCCDDNPGRARRPSRNRHHGIELKHDAKIQGPENPLS